MLELGLFDADVLGYGVEEGVGEIECGLDLVFVAVEIHCTEGLGGGVGQLFALVAGVFGELLCTVEVSGGGVVYGLEFVGEPVGEVGLAPIVGGVVQRKSDCFLSLRFSSA